MLTLSWPGGPLRGTGRLPASKSEANRALLLQRLAGGGQLTNLSEANDTVLMQRLLGQAASTALLDAQDAGTVHAFPNRLPGRDGLARYAYRRRPHAAAAHCHPGRGPAGRWGRPSTTPRRRATRRWPSAGRR